MSPFTLALLLGLAGSAAAAPALDGRAVIQKVLDREDGRDSEATVEMLLTDRTGYTEARLMTAWTKDAGPLSRTLIRFLEPASIAGTSFLSWQVKGKDDEQFLYLPDLGRDRRIVSGQKNSSFVNTDYTYEDMEERKLDADTHKLLREEKREGLDCWVVESTPKKAASSQYKRWIVWVPKGVFLPVRVEFHGDTARKATKTLTVRRLEKVQGIWTALETEMRDLKRNHTTLLRVREMAYNTGLSDRMFSREALNQPR